MLGVQVFKYVEQTETLYCSKSNCNKFLQQVGSHCHLQRFVSIVSTRENALLISKIVILARWWAVAPDIPITCTTCILLHFHLFQRLESDDNSVPPDSHEFHCQGGRGNVRQPHNEQPAR